MTFRGRQIIRKPAIKHVIQIQLPQLPLIYITTCKVMQKYKNSQNYTLKNNVRLCYVHYHTKDMEVTVRSSPNDSPLNTV